MDTTVRFMILIPTLNNVNDIDETIQSIKQQEYSSKNVYVACMDFGSIDGTYEKLISYTSERFGIYTNQETKNFRLMLSMLGKVNNYVFVGGTYSYVMVLYPGDVIYPFCLTRMADCMVKNKDKNSLFLVCESDIKKKNGNIVHQIPLFDEDIVINGTEQFEEFMIRGYDHQIHVLHKGFFSRRYRMSFEINESRWWNKCARVAYEHNVCYVREPLICEKEIEYEDEFEEILLRWESLINQIRSIEYRYSNVDVNRIKKGYLNLAQYSLWRCSLLIEKDKWIEAERCLYMSSIIDESIVRSNLYKTLAEKIEGRLN